jgi:exonuclease III
MNQINHFIQNVLIIAVMAMILSGCKKFVEIDEPIDRITTSSVFSNDQSATSAVLGVYSQMMITLPYIFSGGTTIYAGLSADELDYTGTSADILGIRNNSITANNSIISTDHWQRAYTHIYQVNACMEGLDASNGVSAAVKQQLRGELKFLRAYMYYYLVNLFGDVPLQTSAEYQVNAVMSRSTVDDVYKQIVADLSDAKQLLGASYPSAGKARPNKYAAAALLARVYMHQQRWAEAEQEATGIIASGVYSIVSNLDNVFLANSIEAIWQLAPVFNGFNTTEGARFIPSGTAVKPTYILTTGLLNAFEMNDQRKTAWTKFNTISAQQFYYPTKYKVRMNATVTEYYMMLRLAELYLLRAEARAEQDKITEARGDLNIIRGRAGLVASTVNTKTALLDAIEKERRIELFAEWGHRWIDLKRRGRINMVMQGVKPNWQPHAALYPIPASQLVLNPLLVQNPGY